MNMVTNTQTRFVLYTIQVVIEKIPHRKLYLKLSYIDWELKVIRINQLIREDNK